MRAALRKSLMIGLGFVCLALAVVGGFLPIMQGWIFFVIAIYIFSRESETVQGWIKRARRRWPNLSEHMKRASRHRWAPRHLHEFVDHTDPDR